MVEELKSSQATGSASANEPSTSFSRRIRFMTRPLENQFKVVVNMPVAGRLQGSWEQQRAPNTRPDFHHVGDR
jgi:hypothetical protein